MKLLVDIKAEALLARLAGAADRMERDLRTAVQRLAIKAQARVKGDKLTGQVLHVRTGTLRRSINQRVEQTEQGTYATVGTNVRYAAIHEFGFTGAQNVREHVRKLKTGGVAHVRGHVRKVVMPRRSFLMSTLQDMEAEIQSTLRAAVLKGLSA